MNCFVRQISKRKVLLCGYRRQSTVEAEQSANSRFVQSVKDAIKGGERYGSLLLASFTVIGGVIGLSFYIAQQGGQIKLLIEKQKANEKLADERQKANEKLADKIQKANEKLTDAMDEKLTLLMNEKANVATAEATKAALENFLKYSYSTEYKDMRKP
jgi:predicted aminopeptidase